MRPTLPSARETARTASSWSASGVIGSSSAGVAQDRERVVRERRDAGCAVALGGARGDAARCRSTARATDGAATRRQLVQRRRSSSVPSRAEQPLGQRDGLRAVRAGARPGRARRASSTIVAVVEVAERGAHRRGVVAAPVVGVVGPAGDPQPALRGQLARSTSAAIPYGKPPPARRRVERARAPGRCPPRPRRAGRLGVLEVRPAVQPDGVPLGARSARSARGSAAARGDSGKNVARAPARASASSTGGVHSGSGPSSKVRASRSSVRLHARPLDVRQVPAEPAGRARQAHGRHRQRRAAAAGAAAARAPARRPAGRARTRCVTAWTMPVRRIADDFASSSCQSDQPVRPSTGAAATRCRSASRRRPRRRRAGRAAARCERADDDVGQQRVHGVAEPVPAQQRLGRAVHDGVPARWRWPRGGCVEYVEVVGDHDETPTRNAARNAAPGATCRRPWRRCAARRRARSSARRRRCPRPAGRTGGRAS